VATRAHPSIRCNETGFHWSGAWFRHSSITEEYLVQPLEEVSHWPMFASFPTGYGAGINPQPPGKFLLGKATEPSEGDYSLAETLGLGILGRVAQELDDDPGHEAKGGG